MIASSSALALKCVWRSRRSMWRWLGAGMDVELLRDWGWKSFGSRISYSKKELLRRENFIVMIKLLLMNFEKNFRAIGSDEYSFPFEKCQSFNLFSIKNCSTHISRLLLRAARFRTKHKKKTLLRAHRRRRNPKLLISLLKIYSLFSRIFNGKSLLTFLCRSWPGTNLAHPPFESSSLILARVNTGGNFHELSWRK